ncbi:MAG TPA: VIT domain-containing protein, partial [Chloroflexota bacterium]|nr:VIT domain-containing protein [Chloroflexota bacterium]
MAQVSKGEAILGEIVGVGEIVSTLPLSHTEVQGQVVGLQATISLVQHFANPFDATIEVGYRFAIPHRAALAGFEIRVGNRTIAGEIAERAEAEATYRTAVAEGRRAALATEERPNLYTVQIGQIHPGETVLATYRYSLPVELDGGEFSLVLPFGVTPRYHNPQEDPRDAARTTVVTAPPGSPIGDLDITLAIDAGLPIADPVSSSHQVAVSRSDERRCLVRLVEPRLPNQDFVLRYAVRESGAIGSRAWWTRGEWGNLLYAIFVPPPPDQSAEPEPREYVFVLDRSGSMSGRPIAQARNALRACLRLLGQSDTFRILTFDNVAEWYGPSREKPQVFSRETLHAADGFLGSVEGRGGTEIVAALAEVAGCPRDPRRRRVVVLFTDGAVSAEEQAARLVAEKLSGDRLFCFGIGPAVNRYLLDQLSRAGRGVAEVVGLDEDIEGAIIRFQDRLSYPVLSDLTLTVEGAPAQDLFPSPLPDLYAGAALQVAVRLGASENPRLRL